MTKRTSKLGLIIPTAAEDAEINEGIVQDNDTVRITPEILNSMKPIRRVGRPKSESNKVQVTIRVDSAVLEAFKAEGAGWQTRMNEALTTHIRMHHDEEDSSLQDLEVKQKELLEFLLKFEETNLSLKKTIESFGFKIQPLITEINSKKKVKN
ncbi:MAG: BrnA antitoxin family protein [Delftia acidovorans]|jgi:uncharacterized protein (DUF4415 family)|nr:BrnA antitoxin family protein [Delftia acidovorans]